MYDKSLLGEVNSHVMSLMENTKTELSKIQDAPTGMKPRSKREFGIIMTRILKLPPEERSIKLQELANIAGHEGDIGDGCELCNWIIDSLKKKE